MWGRPFLLAGILATAGGPGRHGRERVTADSAREAGVDAPACARLRVCHRPADAQSGCGLWRIARCFPWSVNWLPSGRPTSLWWPRRPLATLGRKPRQGRKAATVSIDAGAEVSRRGHRLFGHSHSLMPAVATASFPAHRMNPGARQQRYRSTRTPRSAGGVTAFSGTGHSLMPAATALLPMPRNRRMTRPADGSNPSPR